MTDKVYRVQMRRKTWEYIEVEVEAPSMSDAITNAQDDPYGHPELQSWDDAEGSSWDIIEAEEIEGD